MKTLGYDIKTAIERKKINEIKNLQTIGKVFMVAILISLIYFAFSPKIPEIIFQIKRSMDNIQIIPYKNHLEIADNSLISEKSPITDNSLNTDNYTLEENQIIRDIPEKNTLYIPKINVDAIIYEGLDDTVLNYGVWRKPLSSKPDMGGNVVLTANRFKDLSGPNPFFDLGKLERGDKFAIYWEKSEYDYEVYEKIVVSSTEISIEYSTDNSIATLFSNSYNSESRVLVRGRLVGKY